MNASHRYKILNYIRECPGQVQSQIARRSGVNVPATKRVLGELEADGEVQSYFGRDCRNVKVVKYVVPGTKRPAEVWADEPLACAGEAEKPESPSNMDELIISALTARPWITATEVVRRVPKSNAKTRQRVIELTTDGVLVTKEVVLGGRRYRRYAVAGTK